MAALTASVVVSGAASPAAAQVTSWGVDEFIPPADLHWRALAAEDVKAAHQLIQENHPGAAPEAGDTAFQSNLARAYSKAMRRAGQVSSYQGYSAVLAGFATDLGDKHIWSRPTFITNLPRWTGIMMTRRGDKWVVGEVRQGLGSPAVGDELIECDGVAAAELARRNLGGFRGVWSVEAQQIQTAPWLLVDEGNPFISRPKSCEFDGVRGKQTVQLDWTRIKRTDLLPHVREAAGAGAAGFGIRRVGDGYWIAIEDLDDRGADVAKAVEARAAELRAGAFVVLDVRGNGGGSSGIGRTVADALFGRDQVAERLGALTEGDCGGPDGAWRASPGNVANLKYLLTKMQKTLGPEGLAIMREQLRLTQLAASQHRTFSGPLRCPSVITKLRNDAATGLGGPLILLTDNLCFSSCLSVTDDFRRLGAFHVGQTTDAATHYTEVREAYLPSGYSMFSTLQTIDASDPLINGPYVPDLRYDGDIADTSVLEAWVIGTAVPAARTRNEARR